MIKRNLSVSAICVIATVLVMLLSLALAPAAVVRAGEGDHDTDGDGMPNEWEINNNLNPHDPSDAQVDSDGDGLINLQEYLHDANPHQPDTDEDTLPDGWEVDNGLNPNDPGDAEVDSDGDGLINFLEYHYHTNPRHPDTDEDGLPDGWEVNYGLNPLDADDAGADPDNDGLTNLQEYPQGTNPRDPDSDQDGYSDAVEVAQGTNPLDPNSHPAASAAVTGAIVSPQAGQYLSSTAASIAGYASALNGLVSVQVSPNGSTWYTATGTSTWTWSWTLPAEDGVAYLLQARARDRVGQIALLTPTNVIVDRVAPLVWVTYPPAGHVVRSYAEVISGMARDGSGLARQEVSVDDGATWYDTAPEASWSWPWSIPAEDGVAHRLRVRTTDRAGNVSAPAAPIAVFVDNVAPTLSYLNLPTNGQTTISTTTFTVMGRSSGALTTTLDSGAGPQIVTIVGDTFTRTIDLVVTGTHVLTSTAVDGVGNLTLITSTLEVRPQQPLAPHRLFLPLVLRNFDSRRDQYESDDTVANARPITMDGVPQRHNFYPVHDVDWAWFEATPGTYLINTTGLAVDTDTVLRLYASNGVTKLAENDDCTSTTRSSCLTWQVTTGGTLYVQIAPYDQTSSGAERWYDLAIVKQ